MNYFIVIETPTHGDFWVKNKIPEFTRNYDERKIMDKHSSKEIQHKVFETIKGLVCRVLIKEDTTESLEEFKKKWIKKN